MKKIKLLLNLNQIKYIGTYTNENCKVKELINSQYLIIEFGKTKSIKLNLKFAMIEDKKIAITLLDDKEYSIWDSLKREAIYIKGKDLLKMI